MKGRRKSRSSVAGGRRHAGGAVAVVRSGDLGNVISPHATSHDAYKYIPAYQAATSGAGALNPLGDLKAGALWHRLLLGTVAAGSPFFYGGRRTEAQCAAQVGNSITCTGNLAAGVNFNGVGGLTTLNVNTLTANIAPAGGTTGIYFNAVGAATLNSNTTPFAINTTGAGRGIRVQALGADPITVNHTGNITSFDIGVQVESDGGGVTVNTTGNIVSTGNTGMYVADFFPGNGGVNVTHVGNITANSEGLQTYSAGGTTINTTGDITSATNEGIKVTEFGNAPVTITHTGDITSDDDGIYAYSDVGTLAINTNGNITSATRPGIYARNHSNSQITINHAGGTITSTTREGIFSRNFGGDSTVNINGGTVTGATAGVRFRGANGTTHTLNNAGTVTSAALAVQGGDGDEIVNNFGTITGNINLAGGTNAINNMAGGTLNSGANIVIGAGNNLNNAGNVSPGGPGVIQTTALSSNFVQTAGGRTTVDMNLGANTADQITATNATLAGTFNVNIINLAAATNQTVTVLTSTNAITNNGVGLVAPAAFQGILTVNPNNVQITYTVNFNAPGVPLTPDQQGVANTITTIFGSGPPAAFVPLLTALANLPAGAYQQALDQLSGKDLGNVDVSAFLASIGNTNNLFSCPVLGGALAYIKEGECLWVRPQGRDFRQGAGSTNPGFQELAYGVSLGGQVALTKDKAWHGGIAVGFESSTLTSLSGRNRVTGEKAYGGVVVKYQWGASLISAGVSGGVGWFDSTRSLAFAGFAATARGSFNQAFVTGRLRFGHLINMGRVFLKPQLDLDVTWTRRNGFTETGAGAANLTVRSQSDVTFSASPSVELGFEYKIRNEITIRPYVRAGVTIFSRNTNRVTAGFAAAPTVASFTTTTKFDRVFANVDAGVTIFLNDKAKRGQPGSLALRIEYQGRFAANSRQHSISAKFSFKF